MELGTCYIQPRCYVCSEDNHECENALRTVLLPVNSKWAQIPSHELKFFKEAFQISSSGHIKPRSIELNSTLMKWAHNNALKSARCYG